MKYSVIIPVYNAQKTIRRCADSLLVQSYSDTEIILVNDGSTDLSGMICEEYARMHNNVRYICQQNAGVSAARNAGLDAAVGKYVLFVDSDDYVSADLFSNLDRIINDEHTDWIQFSGCVDNGIEKRSVMTKPFVARSREELMPYIVDSICNKSINGPWAKLYKREIIEKYKIRFPVGASVAEDRAFNIAYSIHINSMVASVFVGYALNTENENSLSRKRHKDLNKQFEIVDTFIDKAIDTAGIPDKEKKNYHQAVNFGKCRSIYHDAKLMIQDHEKWMSRQKALMKLCKRINRKHMKYPKTRYCTLITLPVRLYMTSVIDAIAWKLTRG